MGESQNRDENTAVIFHWCKDVADLNNINPLVHCVQYIGHLTKTLILIL